MEILVLAPYPNDENIKDGMIIRVNAIDGLMASYKRRYLNIALGHGFRKKVLFHSEYVREEYLHPIFHVFYIIKILLSFKNIYAHSINAFRHIPYSLFFLDRKICNLILDAHGVVPEEFKMYNKNVKAFYLGILERLVFKKISHCISVSKVMNDHFRNKYIKIKNSWNDHLYYINNSSLGLELVPDEALVRQLGIKSDDCVMIYSGNMQKWQNIDKMLQKLSALSLSKFKIIILTGEKESFMAKLKEYGLESNVYINSVKPNELGKYYYISHYGFLLRDDIVVNNVANPTKMLEYLTYGIVPIVISPKIGDYLSLGYEFLELDKLDDHIEQQKSAKNRKVAAEVLNINTQFNLASILRPESPRKM